MAKKKYASIPLRQPDDCERMTAAIDWALSERLSIIRPTHMALKIGPFNFFPHKGTFHREGHAAGKQRGLRAFKDAVRQWQEDERRDFL